MFHLYIIIAKALSNRRCSSSLNQLNGDLLNSFNRFPYLSVSKSSLYYKKTMLLIVEYLFDTLPTDTKYLLTLTWPINWDFGNHLNLCECTLQLISSVLSESKQSNYRSVVIIINGISYNTQKVNIYIYIYTLYMFAKNAIESVKIVQWYLWWSILYKIFLSFQWLYIICSSIFDNYHFF